MTVQVSSQSSVVSHAFRLSAPAVMGCDWNGVLAYTTVKCVKIRNWKLGVRPSTPLSDALPCSVPSRESNALSPVPPACSLLGTLIHFSPVFRPAADDALHVSVGNLLLRYAPRCQHSCALDHLVFVHSIVCAFSLHQTETETVSSPAHGTRKLCFW